MTKTSINLQNLRRRISNTMSGAAATVEAASLFSRESYSIFAMIRLQVIPRIRMVVSPVLSGVALV